MGRGGSKRSSAPLVAPPLVLSDCVFVYLYIYLLIPLSFRLLHRACLALRAFSDPSGTRHNQRFTLFSHLKRFHTLTTDEKWFVRIRCNCNKGRFHDSRRARENEKETKERKSRVVTLARSRCLALLVVASAKTNRNVALLYVRW